MPVVRLRRLKVQLFKQKQMATLRYWCLGFKRKKIKFTLISVVLFAVIFIMYQFFYFKQLTHYNSSLESVEKKYISDNDLSLRGVLQSKKYLYKRDENNLFKCIESHEKINSNKINDDYCDCADGSDEPGTSACQYGIFHCTEQQTVKGFHKAVPSSRVNDGICDCCDGSDEWMKRTISHDVNDETQIRLRKYLSPCGNHCY